MPKPGVSLARALSKLGYCSRAQALLLINAGKVKINGEVVRNHARRIAVNFDRVEVENKLVNQAASCYLVLNKPRGLVTTTHDEKERETVYKCLDQANLPRLIPVGRLDKASEGLLLFTNDTAWSNRITDPASHLDKVYHVQIKEVADARLLQKMSQGIKTPAEILSVKRVRIIRAGKSTSWLEIVLDEGRNRQIRRILENLNIPVLRLIRIAIGSVQMGNLAKGQYRFLNQRELADLRNEVTGQD
jgi:23S rRNA pseudouridine2605 synthase